MSSQYASDLAEIATTLAEEGASVAFTRVTSVYNPATDANSPTTSTSQTSAIGKKNDWQKFAALGLTVVIPQTLLVAAQGMAVPPQPGDSFVWAGKTFAVVHVEALSIDGLDLLYTVIGSR